MIVRTLDEIVKDERSAFFKPQYIQIFNMLLSAVFNDNQISYKV